MAKNFKAIPLALAVVLGTPMAAFAQSQPTDQNTPDQAQTQSSSPSQGNQSTQTPMTRAEAAIHPGAGVQIADLKAGSWATNATQVAVANNILPLDSSGNFHGDEMMTHHDLTMAMNSLVNTAENISGKGALLDLRNAVGVIPDDSSPVTRVEAAQTMARFLDAASHDGLVALASPRATAFAFRDVTGGLAPAVQKVVDRYKVMTGYPDGTFKPNADVTRYQMAAIALNILNAMRQAPVAQLPAQPQAPTVVVVPPQPQAPTIAQVPVNPVRPNFRQRTPINLSWQALNSQNLSGTQGAFNTIPVAGMFTGYQGPVMLQNVTNFRYDLYQANLFDTDFRLGYSDWKWGMAQLIPYIGADFGIGASSPTGSTQYDTYVGASYGGILSIMPMDNLELWGTLGQTAMLGAGRWNGNFQPISYPGALGSFTSNYGIGLDFYVSPNIALSLGVNTWQQPINLRSGDYNTSGVINTMGGNIGLGFGF